MNSTSSRQRDRESLKELVKLAETAPPSSKPTSSSHLSARPSTPASGRFESAEPKAAEREENSGLIHLGALAAAESPAAEATDAPASSPAAQERSENEKRSSAAAAARPRSAGEEGKSTSRRFYVVGLLVAASAAAAGAFVTMKRPAAEPPSAVAAAPLPGTPDHAVAPKPAVMPVAAADKGVDPSSLPLPVETSNPGAPGAAAGSPRTGGSVAAIPVAVVANVGTPAAASASANGTS